jgi:two-component system, LuxR family, response regulator FixJ
MSNRQSGRVVAVVDDDAAVRDSLCMFLECVGLDVLLYASAREYLRDSTGSASCLLIDHHMPELSGLDLMAELRRRGETLPVILMTGAISTDIVHRAAKLGFANVLEKPVAPEKLLSFVEGTFA